MQTVLTILHVATAVFIIGPMVVIPMTGLRALRSGDTAHAHTLVRSTALFTWLSLIVFALGFGVLGMAPKSSGVTFTTPWILWSIILYVVGFLVAVLLVVPRMRRAVAAMGGSGREPAGYGVIAGSSGVVALLMLAVVVLMVWHPGA